MGKSGHFARKCMLLVSDLKLRDDENVCRSIHPIQYEVKSSDHLKRLVGREYRLPNERDYHTLTKDETNLIGKKILVKSPLTCTSKHGFCKDCYGHDLFHTNRGGVGIGAFAG